ncbi:MAG: hypothetical protein KAS92_00260 [Candidatus Omnitrophica bacterium]|nr:hypothetical protein [Candidatus Omnitrophota bacterium]
MGDKTRRLRLKKLDALYIVHNPLDCLIIYFCVCFTFIRIVYDFYGLAPVKSVYFIALGFTVSMGLVMRLWAKRAFKDLNLKDIV